MNKQNSPELQTPIVSPKLPLSPQSPVPPRTNTIITSSLAIYNPFIYGSDIDSVDVATRIAMVNDLFTVY